MENEKIKEILKKYFLKSITSKYYYCKFKQKYRWNKTSGIEVEENKDINKWISTSWHMFYKDISTYKQNIKERKRKEKLLMHLNNEAIDKLLEFNLNNFGE